jgi:malonate-semialdehyde dehydrogenase (acetylating)/methylmalonate-semialdehyde dehydrogenase
VSTQTREAMALKNLVGDAWVSPSRARMLDVMNPASGEVLGRVPLSTAADADAAVRAAARAFPTWRATPVVERARVMFRYKQLLEEHFEELSRLVSEENGKTLDEARGEVRRGIEVVEFACGIPTLMMGSVLDNVARGIDTEMFRAPLGVVAGICPFNFPAMIPLWMIPVAVASGNTFVLKPSERTPLTGMRLAELLREAGAPAGVINVLHGAKEAVDLLLAHPDVKAISFVGSAPVAEYVYATAAAHGKRVQALAGAKNHMIVMPDADLDATVPAIIASAFGNAGERCLAGSVVEAVGDVADELVARLAAAASRLRVGPGSDSATEMGPVIRPEHRDRIGRYIEEGVRDGARLVCDGRAIPAAGGPGFFIGATVFDAVRPEMSIARDEIFGPVLGVIRVPTFHEALELVNGAAFGNMAVIFTRSGRTAREFRARVQAGMIGINVGVPAPMAFFPFAGWKGSFYGDLHATGRDAVEFYTEKKVVTSRWA